MIDIRHVHVPSRFKSSLVDTETYLLRCYRYIELNPVRAKMVAAVLEYEWSSAHFNASGRADPVVKPHEVYLGIATTEVARHHAYTELLAQGLSNDELEAIRMHIGQGRALV